MQIGQWTTDQLGHIVTLERRYEDSSGFRVTGRVLSFEHGTSPPHHAGGHTISEPATLVRLEVDSEGEQQQIRVLLPASYEVQPNT